MSGARPDGWPVGERNPAPACPWTPGTAERHTAPKYEPSGLDEFYPETTHNPDGAA